MRELGLITISRAITRRRSPSFARARGRAAGPAHHAYSDVKRDLAQTAHRTATDARHAQGSGGCSPNRWKARVRVGDKSARSARTASRPSCSRTWESPARRWPNTSARSRWPMDIATQRESTEAHRGDAAARAGGVSRLPGSRVETRGGARPGQSCRPRPERKERALRRLEFARDANFGATRTGELDAATASPRRRAARADGGQSLKIAAMLKRELLQAEQAKLAALQPDMSNLHAELDRDAHGGRGQDAPSPRSLGRTRARLAHASARASCSFRTRSATSMRTSGRAATSGILVSVLAEIPAGSRAGTDRAWCARPAGVTGEGRAGARTGLRRAAAGGTAARRTPSAVEIVAEGRIAGVPFAGLRSPTNRTRRLVETHAITMITSMFAAEESPRLKQARPFRLVALASGSGTLRSAAVADPAPKLQAATDEIRAIADLFEARDRPRRSNY